MLHDQGSVKKSHMRLKKQIMRTTWDLIIACKGKPQSGAVLAVPSNSLQDQRTQKFHWSCSVFIKYTVKPVKRGHYNVAGWWLTRASFFSLPNLCYSKPDVLYLHSHAGSRSSLSPKERGKYIYIYSFRSVKTRSKVVCITF